MDVDYDLTFDVEDDGQVLMHIHELPGRDHLVTLDLHPDVADRIGDALKAQADRSRRARSAT